MDRTQLIALMALMAVSGVGVYLFTAEQTGAEAVGIAVFDESMLKDVSTYHAGAFMINFTRTGYNEIGPDTNPYTKAHYVLTVTNTGVSRDFTFRKSYVQFLKGMNLSNFQIYRVIEKQRFNYTDENNQTGYRWAYAWNDTSMTTSKTVAIANGTTDYVVILTVPRWSADSFNISVDTPLGKVDLG